jgi:hypothetical protein
MDSHPNLPDAGLLIRSAASLLSIIDQQAVEPHHSNFGLIFSAPFVFLIVLHLCLSKAKEEMSALSLLSSSLPLRTY